MICVQAVMVLREYILLTSVIHQNRYEVSILVLIWGAYLPFLDRDSEKADRECLKKRGIWHATVVAGWNRTSDCCGYAVKGVLITIQLQRSTRGGHFVACCETSLQDLNRFPWCVSKTCSPQWNSNNFDDALTFHLKQWSGHNLLPNTLVYDQIPVELPISFNCTSSVLMLANHHCQQCNDMGMIPSRDPPRNLATVVSWKCKSLPNHGCSVWATTSTSV